MRAQVATGELRGGVFVTAEIDGVCLEDRRSRLWILHVPRLPTLGERIDLSGVTASVDGVEMTLGAVVVTSVDEPENDLPIVRVRSVEAQQ